MPINLSVNAQYQDSITINGDNGGVGRVILGQGGNCYWGPYKRTGFERYLRQDFSAASSLPITNPIYFGGTDNYILIISNLTCSVPSASLSLQFSIDTGLSWSSLTYNQENSFGNSVGTTNQSSIRLMYSVGTNSEIRLNFRNMNSTINKVLVEAVEVNGSTNSATFSGTLPSTDLVNGFRIYPSSGTISGRYALYGI